MAATSKLLIALCVLAVAVNSFSSELRQYGKATVVQFGLYDLTGINLANAQCQSGDVSLAGPVSPSSPCFLPVPGAPGAYSIALSEPDLEVKDVTIIIRDNTAPKAFLDQEIVVSTYGDPAARHPFIFEVIPPPEPEPEPPEVKEPVYYGSVVTQDLVPSTTVFDSRVTNSSKTSVFTVEEGLEIFWITGPLSGRTSSLVSMVRSGNSKSKLTVDEMPEAPRLGDQFIIW